MAVKRLSAAGLILRRSAACFGATSSFGRPNTRCEVAIAPPARNASTICFGVALSGTVISASVSKFIAGYLPTYTTPFRTETASAAFGDVPIDNPSVDCFAAFTGRLASSASIVACDSALNPPRSRRACNSSGVHWAIGLALRRSTSCLTASCTTGSVLAFAIRFSSASVFLADLTADCCLVAGCFAAS